MSQNTSHAVMAQRHEPRIVTLAEARAEGLKWYRLAAPCPRGHLAKRSVSNRDCRACDLERRKRRAAKNPEAAREKERQFYHRNGDRKREAMRQSRARRVEDVRRQDKERYQKEAMRRRDQANRYWREHRSQKYAYVAQRKRHIKLATPPWLSADQRDATTAFYLDAQRRDGEWHVDHIVPLRGKTVCGLHVPWNLQILPGVENRRKGNAE